MLRSDDGDDEKSPRAALIYQHATSEADRAIAEAMNALLPPPEQAMDDAESGG